MRPHLSLISLLVCLGLVASSEPLACELKTRHEQCRAGALTTYSPERTDPRRVVAVGDVHGAFDGLLQVLYSANVTASPTHCEWREQGAGTVLVQVGDLVDRGAHSWEAFTCLRELQRSAAAVGSKVVRLVGNHDIWWLNGYFHKRSPHDTKAKILQMIQALVDDIADGLIAAAYVHHIYDVPIMFSHAGISANFYAYLERQLRKKNKSIFSFDKTSNTKKSKNTLSAEEIAGYVNGVLSKQVAACTRFPCHEFGHEVFEAGPDRGGSGIGGPFWVDFSSLEAAAKNQLEPRHILQVVGHTMAWCYDPRREGVHPPLQQTECALGLVRPTHDLQSVCVDGGMYLGARAYLTIGVDAHFRAHQAHVPFVGGMAGTGVDTGAGVGAYQVRDLTAAACRMSALAS